MLGIFGEDTSEVSGGVATDVVGTALGQDYSAIVEKALINAAAPLEESGDARMHRGMAMQESIRQGSQIRDAREIDRDQ
jgi:hypothetical protein